MEADRHMPPELEDMVIDHLYGNRAALRSCSLVCKSWKHRAQPLLFHRVDLGLWRNEYEANVDKQSLFKHITAHPHLCLYVRNLRVRGRISAAALVAILRHSRNIEHLDFVRVMVEFLNIDPSPPALFETLLVALVSLQELRTARLHVHFFGHGSPPPMMNTPLPVTGLRRLQSLDLGLSEPYAPSHIHPALRQTIVHSRAFASEATCCPISHFGIVLRFRHEFRHDNVRAVWNDEIQNNNLLLKDLGFGIEHLNVTVQLENDFFGNISQLQLSPCARLRSIEIAAVWTFIELVEGGDNRHLAFAIARAVLSSLPSEAPLEAVTLVIEHGDFFEEFFGPVGSARHLDALGALEERLCSLPHLKSFTLQGRGNEVFGDDRSVHVWASQHLPRLAAKEGVVIRCDKAALPSNMWNDRT